MKQQRIKRRYKALHLLAGAAFVFALHGSAVADIQTLVFADTFDTASTAINADLATRQTGILTNKIYEHYYSGQGSASISGNQLLAPSAVGVFNTANLHASLTNAAIDGFIVSFKLNETGSDWVSPYLSTHDDTSDERGKSRFGLLIYNNAGGVSMYGGTGSAQESTTISPTTLTSILGSAWNAADPHTYKLVAIATTANTGTYDLYIDDKKVNDASVVYSLGTTGGTMKAGYTGLFWVVRNITGGAGYFDNLSISTYVIPPKGTVIRFR